MTSLQSFFLFKHSCSENVKNNYAQFVYPLELKHVIIGFVLSDLCYVFIIILGVIAKGDSKIILYCVVFDAATTLETKTKLQPSYASVFR